MKRLLFFICLGCGAANAATMCVPDLGSCTSCTDAKVIAGFVWSATCCGVQVMGIQQRLPGEYYSSDDECFSVELGVYDVNGTGYPNNITGGEYDCISCGCVVFVPEFLAQGYAFKAKYDYDWVPRLCKPIDCANNAATIVQNLF